jgi:hypothetical protein
MSVQQEVKQVKIQRLLMVTVAVAALMVAGSAQAKTNVYINCQVDVQWSFGTLALELSQSAWDLGAVPRGGLKDTWFGEPTHGKFWVRNTGDTNAAVFITTAEGTNMFGPNIFPSPQVPPTPSEFAMAVATNIECVVATWKVLDHVYIPQFGAPICGRYMRVLMPGDYMLFDLRFYAGSALSAGSDCSFRVGVYATSGESETP